MIRRQSIVVALLAFSAAVSAISKKSDENPGLQPGSQPVYSAPVANVPYSVPSQYSQNNVPDHTGQGQMQSGSPQSNLYYYYYPVQEKPKEASYQHPSSSAGHPSSAVHDGTEHSSMDAAASGSEISYSAQDMNQEFNPQAQGFDPQALSNLASQLQGYAFNNGPNNYDTSNPALAGYGPQGDASNHMPTQVHPSYNRPMGGPQGPISFPQGAPFGGQHGFGNFAPGNTQMQPQASEVSSITSGLKKYGLSSILMPVLALAGLSLLLPTVTNLGTITTKTKRSIEDSSISSYIEKVDSYYKLYNKAMEKEECMNRMICELG